VRTVGCLLFVALLVLLSFPLSRAESLSFAVVSDTHVRVSSDNRFYTDFIRAIEEQKINTIFHIGDAIDRPGSMNQWNRFFEITGQDKTVHLAPGNHDIRGKKSLAVYLGLFPRSYYSIPDGDTLFVLLNTELPGEEGSVAGDQFAWLQTEIKKPFRYKFVFLHEPLFPVVPLHGLDRQQTARDRLHRLFRKEGVSLVISGHDHLYNRIEKDGIIYVIAGGGGDYALFAESNCYILVVKTPKGYAFAVKDLQGAVMDKFSVSR